MVHDIMGFPVVILAGRPPKKDALMKYANVENKVLIEFRGKKVVENCIEAVRPFATRILVVGLQLGTIPDEPNIEILEMEGEQYDKIFMAIKFLVNHPDWFEEGRHALFLSGDLPLLNSAMVNRFLERTGDRKFDFYYSIVPKAVFLEKAPDLEWGYMKIRDGEFASGNLILLDPKTAADKYDMIKFLSTNRKSFILGVFKASPWIFLKLVFGRVRLDDAENLMTKMFGITSKLVISDDYEIAFDLDLPEHLDWLRTKFETA